MRREVRRSFDKREPVVILTLSMMKFYRFQNNIFMRPHPAVTAWWQKPSALHALKTWLEQTLVFVEIENILLKD